MRDPREDLKSLDYDYVDIVSKARDIEQMTFKSGNVHELPNMLGFRFLIEKWSSGAVRGVGAVYQYIIVFPEIVIDGSELALGPFRSEELKKYLWDRGR